MNSTEPAPYSRIRSEEDQKSSKPKFMPHGPVSSVQAITYSSPAASQHSVRAEPTVTQKRRTGPSGSAADQAATTASAIPSANQGRLRGSHMPICGRHSGL
ncbi:hypothetical protein GCM10010468_03230 [Actinocorallia longicatena]|uniref:Uncharacterized protein n=1 Tax=Actinocorallia longicatena TaxID=111803 RepID=A0ABP6PWR9_9ACTN